MFSVFLGIGRGIVTLNPFLSPIKHSLNGDNVVEKKQGKGTYVKEQTVLYDANMIGSLTQRLLKQKRVLTTKSKSFS